MDYRSQEYEDEEINWGYRRMEMPFEGIHCPAGAVVPQMDE
jgi:hypothetical protein